MHRDGRLQGVQVANNRAVGWKHGVRGQVLEDSSRQAVPLQFQHGRDLPRNKDRTDRETEPILPLTRIAGENNYIRHREHGWQDRRVNVGGMTNARFLTHFDLCVRSLVHS